MPDNFAAYAAGLDAPASDGAAVTPNNGADLPTSARALYIGTAGDVKVDMVSGTTLTFTAVPAGVILPVRARRVYATGTTATNIVAIY
jgi:hypothetical protein